MIFRYTTRATLIEKKKKCRNENIVKNKVKQEKHNFLLFLNQTEKLT